MIRIAHIVKVMDCAPGSEWAIAQPITFATMRTARDFAAGTIKVELHAAFSPGDEKVVPADFVRGRPLDRDVTSLKTFRSPRSLPLLKDILDRLYERTDAEYMMYTNIDIGLMPHFYTAVAAYIAQGHDAIVINRRTVPAQPNTIDALPFMYSAIGTAHPGYDCFIFRRSAYPSFVLGDVCLGMGHVDTPLICSMIAACSSFLLVRDAHLTFHLGDSRSWTDPDLYAYRLHNNRQAACALRTLCTRSGKTMRWWHRACLRFTLLKNAFLIREFRRLFDK